MDAQGLGEIWIRHLEVIRHLSEAGATVTDLSEQVGLAKQTVGPIVRDLEKAGIAAVGPHPEDGRAHLVRLGQAGRSGMARVARAIEALSARYRSRMGDCGFDELEEGLWLLLDTD